MVCHMGDGMIDAFVEVYYGNLIRYDVVVDFRRRSILNTVLWVRPIPGSISPDTPSNFGSGSNYFQASVD
jgi:hypothetical protein